MAFFLDCVKVSGWSVSNEIRIAEPQILKVVFSRGEAQALLKAVTEPRFRAVLSPMYHCGLRAGEAVTIEVTNKLSSATARKYWK